MELQTPFKLMKDNLLLTKSGDVWTYYKIKSESIATNDLDKKEMNKRMMAFIYGTLSKYSELHLEMLPKDMNLTERFKQLGKDFADEALPISKYYANETVKQLEYELGTITNEEFILGVKLKSFQYAESIRTAISSGYDQFLQKTFSALGYEATIDETYFKQFANELDELNSTMITIKGTPLEENELAYLIRYNFIRNIQHDVLKESKEHNFYKLTDTILDPSEKGFLKLENDQGTSYVAFIPIGALPDNISFSHLFETAQSMKFPVELQIKAQYQEVDGLNGLNSKLSRLRRRFKSTTQEAHQTGDHDSQRNLTNQILLDELQNDIEAGKSILKWLACFVISGNTKEEVKARSNRLIHRLGLRDIEAYRPNADQLSLFYRLLQGNSLESNKNWLQVTNNEGFAENLFAVSNRLGNNVGWYIGCVDDLAESQSLEQSIYASRKIVLLIQQSLIKVLKVQRPTVHILRSLAKQAKKNHF